MHSEFLVPCRLSTQAHQSCFLLGTTLPPCLLASIPLSPFLKKSQGLGNGAGDRCSRISVPLLFLKEHYSHKVVVRMR